MLKSIEGNFDNLEVHELLIKHFIELRSVSPEGSAHVLDISGLKDPSIKFWSLWEEDNFWIKITVNLNQLELMINLETKVMG